MWLNFPYHPLSSVLLHVRGQTAVLLERCGLERATIPSHYPLVTTFEVPTYTFLIIHIHTSMEEIGRKTEKSLKSSYLFMTFSSVK